MPEEVELVELPHYSSLRNFFEVVPTVAGTARAFWRGLDQVDTLWVFGPHPVRGSDRPDGRRAGSSSGARCSPHSVLLYDARVRAGAGCRRSLQFADSTASSGCSARRMKVTGPRDGARAALPYRARRSPDERVHRARGRSAVAPEEAATGQAGSTCLRSAASKPRRTRFCSVEALARLEAERPGRYRLTWVGRGPLEDEVRRRAAEVGVDRLIELHGYIRLSMRDCSTSIGGPTSSFTCLFPKGCPRC